jgi:hypothetical protein
MVNLSSVKQRNAREPILEVPGVPGFAYLCRGVAIFVV